MGHLHEGQRARQMPLLFHHLFRSDLTVLDVFFEMRIKHDKTDLQILPNLARSFSIFQRSKVLLHNQALLGKSESPCILQDLSEGHRNQTRIMKFRRHHMTLAFE